MMYRLAIWCGAFPLVTGVSIFLLWVVFRWDWLAIAGMYVIGIGVVLFLSGVSCLARFRLLALEDSRISYRSRFWKTLAGACLLFINIPAAGTVILAVIHIETSYTVIVQNESDAAVEVLTVAGGGVTVDYGTIGPGARVRRTFHIRCDGVLMCSAIHRGQPLQAQVDGYVTSGMDGRKVIRITPDATLVVTDIDYD